LRQLRALEQGSMEKHLEGTPVILRAIDLVIAEVEQRDDFSEREEALTLLHELRRRLLGESL
jgi:hypothetical protein